MYRFYGAHRRTFPWRKKRPSPYHVLVSEIMLQQTQVSRVAPFFKRFIAQFPSIDLLARASLADVMRVWSGLGYNRRARFLLEASREIVRVHKGNIPRDPALLKKLPGIGKATASSVAVFAFNEPIPFVETNIRSVIIYYFFEGQVGIGDREIFNVVEQTFDKSKPAEWCSALMDYGNFLKRAFPNPSRRSKHYRTQPKFEGSTRQIRGAIVRCLLVSDKTIAELSRCAGASGSCFEKVIATLEKEKIVKRARRRFGLVS